MIKTPSKFGIIFFQILHRDIEIRDISNKVMKAMDVFSICIKHLKDSLLEEINRKVASDILLTDIDFVITVPAIWGDAAKMFMREAAVTVSLFVDKINLRSNSLCMKAFHYFSVNFTRFL